MISGYKVQFLNDCIGAIDPWDHDVPAPRIFDFDGTNLWVFWTTFPEYLAIGYGVPAEMTIWTGGEPWNTPNSICGQTNNDVENTTTMNFTAQGWQTPQTFWDPTNQGWYTIFNGVKGPTDNTCWTPTGWNSYVPTTYGTVASKFVPSVKANPNPLYNGSLSSPLYSLYFEGINDRTGANCYNSNASVSSVTFSGRGNGMDLGGNLINQRYLVLSDISNVSWTTRLTLNPYYWGLAGSASSPLASAGAFSAYQAAAEAYANTYDAFDQVTAVVQTSTLTPVIANVASIDNPLLSTVSVPQMEVACAYGFAGQMNGASVPKPANYDATNISSIQQLALLSAVPDTSGPNQYNWKYCTRSTVNNLQVANLTTSGPNGSLSSPFQISYTKQAFVPNNTVPVTVSGPPCAGIQPTSAIANTITDACGNIVFTVQQECYLNVGSLSLLKTVPYTQYCIYAFNYAELFVGQSQDWNQSGISVGTDLSANQVDLSKLHNTYLQGNPYYMDEKYDASGPYSALGRSLLIGPSSKSSGLLGEPLSPSFETPVIIFLQPCSFDATSVAGLPAGGLPGGLSTTFSNNLMYSFTGAYQLSPTYTIAFTSLIDGPVFTFYGLDNLTAFGPNVKASNVLEGLTPRKVYYELGSTMLNDELGLDVRSVYVSSSQTVGPQNITDPETTAWNNAPFINAAYNFNYVSYKGPNWSNKTTVQNVLYLPLAGTWSGDTAQNADGMPNVYSQTQYVPNYEGLAYVAEIQNITNGQPVFTSFAVDRCARPGTPPANAALDLFTVQHFETFRPQTLFTILCDIWRNTIRQTVVPINNTQSAGFLSGLLPVSVARIDCMGIEDYDATNANNAKYFGACISNGGVAGPLTTGGANDFTVTPWTVLNEGSPQVWSPFTGGSFWNTFQEGGSSTKQDSRFLFPPQLWWPTYRWSLSTTDINNTWPTSIATNSTLLQSNLFVFACSDGTIRKLYLGQPKANELQYPVVDCTNDSTFYNAGVNGSGNDGMPVYSYTWPGRLYNLTWWANNWWCTADNASVWTTANLDTSPPIQINQPVFTETFLAGAIHFRPLSISEGHPESWMNARWPTNEPHKFNVMKIVEYRGTQALFVGSVDGEYIVITEQQNRYQSFLPNNDPQAWGFTPKQDYTQVDQYGPNASTLYVSDLIVCGESLVVGSAVLPLDPQNESCVPWAPDGCIDASGVVVTDAGALPLPLLSLGYTSTNAEGPLDLLGHNHRRWVKNLRDSHTITVASLFPYDGNTNTSVDVVTVLDNLTGQMTTDLLGTPMTPSSLIDGVLSVGQPGTGITRITKPAHVSPDTQGPCDASLAFYDNQNQPNFQISINTLNVAYSVQDNVLGAGVLGSTVLGIQTTNDLLLGAVFPVRSRPSASVHIQTFFQGGLDMDPITRAFFVIDNPVAQPQIGLKDFAAPGSYFSTTSFNTTNVQNVTVQTADDISPNWLNSLAYEVSLRSSDGLALQSNSLKPLNGPLVNVKNNLEPQDYDDLNLFLNFNVKRSAPVNANLIISDMAYAKEAEALAWTLYGPFGPQPIQISSISPVGLLTSLTSDPTYEQNYQPQFLGPSIIGWSPYELKWYAAGLGTNIPDFVNTATQQYLRPSGVSTADWANSSFYSSADAKTGEQPRLLLLSADASAGISDGTNAIKFTQVFKIESKAKVGPNVEYLLKPVSRAFREIRCFGFSPNITAIGGSAASNTNKLSGDAVVCWRSSISASNNDLKANWSLLNLDVPGVVTALKYVGYAWYIAVWDAYANPDATTGLYNGQSTLFFASINFNGVSSLDSWSANQLLEVTSIDATVLSTSTCQPGFEPDPNNPTMCVKVCPKGFTPYGSLCVQTCPLPYTETGIANECVPDFISARLVSPTANGLAPETLDLKLGPNIGVVTTSISWTNVLSLTTIILLVILVLAGMYYKGLTRKGKLK
jgi:hypothetical protein